MENTLLNMLENYFSILQYTGYLPKQEIYNILILDFLNDLKKQPNY
jgi:hypothetical protein